MRKILLLTIPVFLLFCLLTGCGQSEMPEMNLIYESHGDGTCAFIGIVEKELLPDGVLTIPETNYRSEKVTEIGSGVLYLDHDVRKVILPDTIEIIGESAFSGSLIQEIRIPDSVRVIGPKAFADCMDLVSVDLGSGVAEIGFQAFSGCEVLETVRIPGSVKEFGMHIFEDCYSLKSVYFDDGAESVGNYMFKNCNSLTALSFPDTLRTVEYGAFSGCVSLRSVSFPDGVTKIESSTFYGCTALTHIEIPASVRKIGIAVFDECPLFSHILYAGTEEQFAQVEKEDPFDIQVRFGSYDCPRTEASYFFGETSAYNPAWAIILTSAAAVLAVTGFFVIWQRKRIRGYTGQHANPTNRSSGSGNSGKE